MYERMNIEDWIDKAVAEVVKNLESQKEERPR